MQDYQPIPGLAGRIFGTLSNNAGARSGAFNGNTTMEPQLPVKCPRCDSINTKFCYYNNYNLSQPRHFCKSCRRYWTKGGVLRNVPVGGGCRKSKRPASSTKSKKPKSSSDNSSLTTSTTADANHSTPATTNDTRSNPGNSFDPFLVSDESSAMVNYGFSVSLPPAPDQKKVVVVDHGCLESAVGGGGEIPATEVAMGWGGAVDPAMFDFGGGVDSSAATAAAAAFWSQSQWCDVDPSLYLP